MTAGQASDYTGAAALLDDVPKAECLLVDRGYHADWIRKSLKDEEMQPCIPGGESRSRPVYHDNRL